MNDVLANIQRQAEEDPGNPELVHQLARTYERLNWQYKNKTVGEWIAVLESEGWRPSSNASGALSKIGLGAIPPLMKVLSSSSPAARSYASLTIGRIGPAAILAVPPLITTLDDPDWRVRYAAVTALADIGSNAKAAIPKLNILLKDPEPKIKEAVETAINAILNQLPPISRTEQQSGTTTNMLP
ncbi:MAG: HEAT repeat domain-containing protein [Planctomycetota bacterium]|nr:HEAT repeat domain-containing protein [Planctomycetota bacterium]